jgi:PPOX class probable F420-dependent enzyme
LTTCPDDTTHQTRESKIISTDVQHFIDAQRVARLATVDEAGRPHLVPVCFVLDGDTVYSAIDEKPKRPGTKLRRLRNIESNSHVQLLLDVYEDTDWSRLRFVQLRGRARVIGAGEEHMRAIRLLRARYTQYGHMALEERPLVAIDVERVVEWRAS